MRSSGVSSQWVMRWRYEMAAKATRHGIWRLRGGGFFVRVRVTDPRTGKENQLTRVLKGEAVALRDALRVQDQLRSEARDHLAGRRSLPLWSEYAASLFEAKVTEGKLKSGKSRERWGNTLARLVPAFGRFRVDELRYADLVGWRDQVAIWIRSGMPSMRKQDAGKNRLVKLSPVTANGWISILKVICTAMTKHYELQRDPGRAIEYLAVPRIYTREQPNSLAPAQVGAFLDKMKERYPQHYAMTFLGFAIGARPSTLRPLRRRGPEPDVLWDDSAILLRRSNPLRQEIVDQTKTALDQEIPLPAAVMRVLRKHADTLPPGPMADSDLLFPAITGGMRTRSVLDKPFRRVLKTLGWKVRLTPKAMRRTFQDLAREAEVHDFVARAISGHATERMQRHYSTAQREEMRTAVGKVISLATARTERARPARGRA
jgi:hypothetical protein